MKSFMYGTACGIAMLAFAGHVVRAEAPAQSKATQSRAAAEAHTQFTDNDRQTTKNWTSQHQAHPPAGFRAQDRLNADQESRLQPGKRLDPDLQKRVHTVPSDLSHRLPAPPRNSRYVAIGGHVGLVDSVTHVLRDIIRD